MIDKEKLTGIDTDLATGSINLAGQVYSLREGKLHIVTCERVGFLGGILCLEASMLDILGLCLL